MCSAGREDSLGSPLAEHNSTAGGIPSSTHLVWNIWWKEKKLHNVGFAFVCVGDDQISDQSALCVYKPLSDQSPQKKLTL